MPHDANGRPLAPGDEVLMRLKVRSVTAGERDCNVTLDVIDFAESGQTHLPQVACNAKLVEKIPYEG